MDSPANLSFFYAVVFVYGLVFGSFFNVCICRIPKGISIIHPRSRCPKCKSEIRWFQNIPLFSWIFLKGRCASCKTKISFLYPFVELLTGIIILFVFRHFYSPDLKQWIIKSLIFSVFSGSLIILSFIDMKYFIIPDRFTWGGVIVGIGASMFYPQIHGFETMKEGFVFSSVSALICYGILNSVRIIGSVVYKREAMGYGDIKLVAAFGAFLGWKLGLLSIFFGAVFGSVIGVTSVILSRFSLRSEIPFGPYLAIGAYLSLIYGQPFLNWYSTYLMFGL